MLRLLLLLFLSIQNQNETQIVTLLAPEDFEKWQAKNFEPETEFLEKLKAIDGISMIETQNYTVSVVHHFPTLLNGLKIIFPCLFINAPSTLSHYYHSLSKIMSI